MCEKSAFVIITLLDKEYLNDWTHLMYSDCLQSLVDDSEVGICGSL
jgi:hypothetical protein